MFRKLLSTFLFMFLFVPLVWAQTGSIEGTVTDNNGESIPGANVLLVEASKGAATDADGNYSITGIEPGTYTLRVTFVGYQTKNQQVSITAGETLQQDISLSAGSLNLDEVVVIGFGTQSRRNIVGSVSSVKSKSLTELHATTLDKALQGKTAGVQVTSTSGVLGAPVSVRVRGTTSINASSQPLYVVDGVPVVDDELGSNLGVGGDGGINPLVNLDANDIESIEVLKDASAAAIYGSRGANGVVLITTKSGQAGDTQINIGLSTGYSEPTKEYELLSGPEFLQLYNYQTGSTLDPANYASTNWADLVTRTGAVQNYNASVSGGDQQTQFYVSASYSDEEGYARPNALQKYNARARVNHSFNDKLDVGINISPSRSVNNRIATSNLVAAPYTFGALAAPVIPQFYPNGDINDARDSERAPGNAFAIFGGTPYSNIEGNIENSITTQLIANGNAAYDFMPSLTLKTDLSVQFLQNIEESRSRTYSTDGFPDGTGDARNEQFLNYSWRNTLTYSQDWEDHALNVVLGATFQETEQRLINVAGDTYISDQLITLDNAANITGGGGFISAYSFQNNLARISYDYKDRYLLTLTGSYNGSSRFGEDSRYGFFPAAALGWIISDESFVDNFDALSFLKLRASYGITGNAGIDNFDQLALLASGANYNNIPGVAIDQLASPLLSWEETAQLDVGLEYGFFDGRLNGSLGYFNKTTTDLLLEVPVSNTNGFTSFIQNTGKVVNTGFEFDVTADLVQNSNIQWSVNANISTLNNEVKELPAGEFTNNENLVREGEPIGAFYLVEYKGVDPENGDALFADGEGGTTNNFNAAPRKVLGSPHPDYYGGFGTTLGYKGIDASVNFQYSAGNYVYWSDGTFLATNQATWNQQRRILDYWTPENTDASIPEPRLQANGSQNSSRYLEDASYLRLKNAEIGYTLPTEFVGGYNIRVYAQGTNLLTFTEFKGLDPEVTPTSGANVSQGNVFFQLPQPRTVLFGVELGL